MRRSFARWLYRPDDGRPSSRLRIALARAVFRSFLIRHTRHYPGFHQLLVDLQLATWLGDEPRAPTGRMPDDIPAVVNRIKVIATA